MSEPPTSTYRLQLHAGFGFAEVAATADYLAALGVSHVYLSPILQAAPGSPHGYDVVDHSRISAELGGEPGFRAMAAELRRHGLGTVVDIVPNHMGIGAPEWQNRQFWSVLADGLESPCAHWFDIDWAARAGRLLLPILAGPPADCAADLVVDPGGLGALAGDLGQSAAGPVLRYFEHVLPLRPGTAGLPLAELLRAQHYELADWRSAATELNWRRFFDITGLIGLQVQEPDVFAATHGLLLGLVAEGLIDGLRVDHPDGLSDPRGYLTRLATATSGAWVVAEKILTGDEYLPADWDCAGTTGYDSLRMIGGLFTDPAGAEPLTREYVRFTGGSDSFEPVAQAAKREIITGSLAAEVSRLARVAARALAPAADAPEPDAPESGAPEPAWAESGAPERAWTESGVPDPVSGESGVPEPDSAESGVPEPDSAEPDAAEPDAAEPDAAEPGGAEPGGAEHELADPAAATEADLRAVLGELLAGLSVYRTYVVPGEEPSPESVALLADAAHAARDRLPPSLHPLLDAVTAILLRPGGCPGARAELAVRFQQTSGPVMAKGIEDTAFYRWSRLTSLNEVGGEPARLAVSPSEFHAFAARLASDWPATMTTLSTHDTKRGEDVRARLAVLTEQPEDWATQVAAWHATLEAESALHELPEPEIEYLMAQTLAGAWPVDKGRLADYLRKAMREAKTRTSWAAPDEDYENAVADVVAAVCGDPGLLSEIPAHFVAGADIEARINSVSAKLVQLTMPGVPDVYQGCELRSFSLVDPDNRRPVDFSHRRDVLAAIDATAPGSPNFTGRIPDGSLPPMDWQKMVVTSRALRLRREHPDWFAGSYAPLAATGPAAEHVLAFARGGHAVTVVTRLPVGLYRSGPDRWAGTELPLPQLLPGGPPWPVTAWRDVLTNTVHSGSVLPLHQLTRPFPVALLVPAREGLA